MADELVALGDNVSEIKVVGRTSGEVRPIAVPQGVTQGTFYQVVGSFDAAFRRLGTKPTVAQVKMLLPKVGESSIRKVIATPQFEEAMRLRGIGFISEEGLSPQQSAALNLLEDFSDTRKLSVKLRAVGATRTQFNGWLKDPIFRRYYEERVESHLKDSHLSALSTIMTEAENGNLRAAEKILEITGRYNPHNAELLHARAVVQSLVEAMQRHIKDPDLMKAIIADVELAQQMTKITQ